MSRVGGCAVVCSVACCVPVKAGGVVLLSRAQGLLFSMTQPVSVLPACPMFLVVPCETIVPQNHALEGLLYAAATHACVLQAPFTYTF